MGATGSVFMTHGIKGELHARMTIQVLQNQGKYLEQWERIEDLMTRDGCFDGNSEVPKNAYASEEAKLEKLKQESAKLANKWKIMGLPLRENGGLKPFEFAN